MSFMNFSAASFNLFLRLLPSSIAISLYYYQPHQVPSSILLIFHFLLMSLFSLRLASPNLLLRVLPGSHTIRLINITVIKTFHIFTNSLIIKTLLVSLLLKTFIVFSLPQLFMFMYLFYLFIYICIFFQFKRVKIVTQRCAT